MDNPLAEEQREKKGAETFGKYEYQYHWALHKLLDEHKQLKEYAIFIELHEDVIFSNSLQKDTAEFEFYQIKENSSSSQYTANSLTLIKKDAQNSVLGKLIKSYHVKRFKDIVSSANLVSTSGFSKDLLREKLDLEKISIQDIKLRSLVKFKKSILAELELEECPVNVCFIVPKLLPKSQRDGVITAIVDLISTIYPNSQCDAANIYRVLIDELHSKGQVKYDYGQWDALLKNKALTSKTVQKTIETHSSIKGLSDVERDAQDLIGDLGLSFPRRKQLIQSVNNYYTRKLANCTSLNLKLEKSVRELYTGFKHLETAELISSIENTLDADLKKSIGNEHELRAAIICEIITGEV
jgi:hypothetical protein